jgi:hypothetical protein
MGTEWKKDPSLLILRKEGNMKSNEIKWSEMESNEIKNNHITTDDLAFSAYLKMKGYHLLKSDQKKSKSTFIFDVGTEDANSLKVEFINSEFLSFYNELRNLKKLTLN